MLQRITTNDREVALDLSIFTLLEVAESYGEDATTFAESIAKRLGNGIEGMRLMVRFAVIAMNDAAERESRAERVTEWDVRDMMTADPTLTQKLAETLVTLVAGGEEVFPTATAAKSPKKSKAKSHADD